MSNWVFSSQIEADLDLVLGYIRDTCLDSAVSAAAERFITKWETTPIYLPPLDNR